MLVIIEDPTKQLDHLLMKPMKPLLTRCDGACGGDVAGRPVSKELHQQYGCALRVTGLKAKTLAAKGL